MNEDKNNVSYVVYEGTQARLERMNRRVWILCIILIIALLGTNAGWIYYESQFTVASQEVEQEVDTGEGDATVIGIGNYGESKADSTDENPNP